ncbi:hypothetical protein F9B85_10310 [Heliorestis acidaminivorans]|uniref:Uncharacterized protein n=1 Tax=Heliorestis acidaminivorans TaxID=553427 RepID=A0A6I0EYS4_9FIRM|nr:hypothetical protein [Heliorestis acidaminivorans]KAB2951942.1 hypothetical protein F9B85_10310 [Heliorestis acidaminivorans]
MLRLFEKGIGSFIKQWTSKLRSKFKSLTNVNKMVSKLLRSVLSKIKGIFIMLPQSKTDYLKVGQTYIAKKLLLAVIIFGLILLFVFNRFIYPWAEGRFWTPEFVVNYDQHQYATFTGKAKLLHSDNKVLYIGQLEEGRISGEGTLYHPDGYVVYQGQFLQELYNGYGERYAEDGTLIYKGNFDSNMYNGEGQLFNRGYLLYEGQFRDGLFHGEGEKYYINGKVWKKGTFGAGKLHGEGKEYSPNGKLFYQGFFIDGLYDGFGRKYDLDKNKVVYEGHFHKGLYHGTGKVYDPERERLVYEGEFREGRYHGEGNLYNWKGQLLFQGYFHQGTIDYFRYVDVPLQVLREDFGAENAVHFFEHHYLMDYPDLDLFISVENPVDDPPKVHKIILLGEKNFLDTPIGMSMEKLAEHYEEQESSFEYFIDEEKEIILQKLRLPLDIEALHSVTYIVNEDLYIRYYALQREGDVIYYEIGGL